MKKLLLAALFFISGAASAATLTFDDLSLGRITSTYNGFVFDGFTVADNASGFGTHASSGSQYAYADCCVNVDSMRRADGSLFNLINGDFSNLQGQNDIYTVKGFLDGNELYSVDFKVDGNITNQVLNFYGVNQVNFSPKPFGSNVALDTLKTSTVPEPASIAMVGLGLFGLAALRRKSAK